MVTLVETPGLFGAQEVDPVVFPAFASRGTPGGFVFQNRGPQVLGAVLAKMTDQGRVDGQAV